MSTTVQYKGSTIATVSGETKKLTTKGKWLEDDISITAPSDNGTVYQDEEGYVVLDDEPGVNVSVAPLSVTSNGTYTAPTGTAYTPVSVNVQLSLQSKSATPTETAQTITPDNGYYGLSAVTVNAMPTGTLKVPTLAINSTTGVVTASAGISTAGYLATTASTSNTLQLTSKGATTYTPGTTAQTIAAGTYLTGTQTIGAIPSAYVIPSGTISISSAGTYDVTNYKSASVTASVPTIYQLLASRSTIYSHIFGVTEYFNSLTTIREGQFALQPIGGSHTFNNVSKIDRYGFAYVYINGGGAADHTFTFPECEVIGVGAFYSDYGLSGITAPICNNIAIHAFAYCHNLSTISFPVCTLIGGSAFYKCSLLAEAMFPSCTSIGGSAFQSCSSLTTASFPACITINNYAFAQCTQLSAISFPVCTSIGGSAFQSCSSLTTASFPSCTNIGSSAFYGCEKLISASFPKCTSMSGSIFARCYNLISLYLNEISSVPTLGAYVFTSTPIGGYSTSAGRYGSVYVPSSLYNAFLTATNWASISSRIVSV